MPCRVQIVEDVYFKKIGQKARSFTCDHVHLRVDRARQTSEIIGGRQQNTIQIRVHSIEPTSCPVGL
jgi:hypothetical protein